MSDFLTQLKTQTSPSSSLRDFLDPPKQEEPKEDPLRAELRELVKENSLQEIYDAIDDDSDIQNKQRAKEIAAEEYRNKTSNML